MYQGERSVSVRTFLHLLMGPLPRRGAMTLNAVVFDLDGVITDTAHLHFLAWRAVAEGWEDATAAGRLLSAAPGRLTPAVEHLQTAQSCDKMRLAALQNALAAAMAASVTPGAPCVRLAEGADGDGLRKIAVACAEAGASPALCVSPEGRYALAGDNVQALCRALNAAFECRGGGKPNSCQGSFAALPKLEKLEEQLGVRN